MLGPKFANSVLDFSRLLGSRLTRKRLLAINQRWNTTKSNDSWSEYTPRRALMYVPASDDRKLAKISAMNADFVVLDCEDGVAISRKEEARRKAAEYLKSKSSSDQRNYFQLCVRVNSTTSGLLEEDLRVLADSADRLASIMLPKVDSIDDLRRFWELFKVGFSAVDRPISFVILIESARALIDMPAIMAAASQMRTYSPLRLEAAVFGSDDLCADLGAVRSKAASELSYARQKFLLVCKAYRIQAIDMVYIDYKDLDGLRAQCDEARRMGFTGKQIIHPSQVPVVQRAFLPPDDTVAWARRLVVEFDRHVDAGKGAFTFNDQMVDMPLVLQARNVVRMMDKISQWEASSSSTAI